MPAQVPPGHTRGPILFLGATTNRIEAENLLQRFWTDAGGYGARMLLLTTTANATLVNHHQAQFANWGVDELATLSVHTRSQALGNENVVQVENATGILLLDGEPAHVARRLGGTALAQALRRANAHGKTVAALGSSSKLLCQHVLAATPAMAVHFTPGLGLVNRITLHYHSRASANEATQILLAAIAQNPFLVGVHLGHDSGIAIYPDTTLEVLGANAVLLVDGAAAVQDDLSSVSIARAADAGVRYHQLAPGDTFNFDRRAVVRSLPADIPALVKAEANKSSF